MGFNSPNAAQVQPLPGNLDYNPIEVDLRRKSLSVEGIAIGVIRTDGAL